MALTPWGHSHWGAGPWGGFTVGNNDIAERGWESSRVGVPSVQLGTRYLLPAGIPPRPFGAHEVRYGAPRLLPAGIFAEAFGTASVRFQTQIITSASAGDLLIIGIPAVSPFYILPSGWDSLSFGATSVGFVPPYDVTLFVSGWDSLVFGTTSIDNYNRQIFPFGWRDSNASPLHIIPFYPQTRTFQGIEPTLAFGTATVENKVKYPDTSGIFTETFGTALVQNFIQYVFPNGIFAETVGTQLVEPNPRPVSPTGIFGEAFGAALVTLKNRDLVPTGWDSLTFQQSGMPGNIFRVDNATPTPQVAVGIIRTIAPTGIDSLAIPTPTVS